MDANQVDELDQPLEHEQGSKTLDLVERTEELIRATEDHAAEMAERSAAAVAHLQEEMRLAERVLEAAETRRRVSEAEVKQLTAKLEETERTWQERIDSLTSELKASVEQTERAYEERIASLNDELGGLRVRAERAEDRAEKAEHALARVQDTLQGILKVRAPSAERGASGRPRKAAGRA
ncbi:MAG: hypothetical protein K2Y71_01340 [Xanthobacteraceae bacterium]|nr:hypothetical protein [Xanthobacteraceae bacterium]